MPGKTILRNDPIAPFTIERVGDRIILQEYIKTMRLGVVSAKWLLDALKNTTTTFYSPKQELSHEGSVVLTILNESGYIYIIGTKVRFNMKTDVAVKIVEWLEAEV